MRWLIVVAMLLAAPARAAPRWDRWQLLMWQDHDAAAYAGLKALGFTGAKLRATGGLVDAEGQAARRAAGMPWYLENLATDFYATFHRYTPGQPVTWRFDAAKARYRADPSDASVFVREPGLSDPAWLDRVRTRLDRVVRAEGAGRPLFYNLGDESGIGDLASAWDADTAPDSLRAMRGWLRTQYPDLVALNRQWGTAFPDWDAVVPELTDAALRRTDLNFSAWSDFKAWMDVAFARAVRAGTDAVHGADPQALAALEGGQVPGWGGYDYALLAPAVDVMEIYDYGEALDLALAFNPALIPLRTSFGSGPREAHAAWRNLLHGGRGTVVWDEAGDVVQADGTPGPRGRALSALHRALAETAPRLRRPDPDPVAILVSQASFRVGWLLDRRAGDHDWTSRDAEREYDDNAWRAARRTLVQRLGELGVQPRFVATVDAAALTGVKALFLPHAIALSDAEVAAVQAFRAAGGTVLADTEPGLFDGHGRRRDARPLPDVPHPEAVRPGTGDSSPELLTALAGLLQTAGAPPRAAFTGPDGRVATGIEARWFQGPDGAILSVQAARPWGAPSRLEVRLRSGTPLAPIALDGIEPALVPIR